MLWEFADRRRKLEVPFFSKSGHLKTKHIIGINNRIGGIGNGLVFAFVYKPNDVGEHQNDDDEQDRNNYVSKACMLTEKGAKLSEKRVIIPSLFARRIRRITVGGFSERSVRAGG